MDSSLSWLFGLNESSNWFTFLRIRLFNQSWIGPDSTASSPSDGWGRLLSSGLPKSAPDWGRSCAGQLPRPPLGQSLLVGPAKALLGPWQGPSQEWGGHFGGREILESTLRLTIRYFLCKISEIVTCVITNFGGGKVLKSTLRWTIRYYPSKMSEIVTCVINNFGWREILDSTLRLTIRYFLCKCPKL